MNISSFAILAPCKAQLEKALVITDDRHKLKPKCITVYAGARVQPNVKRYF